MKYINANELFDTLIGWVHVYPPNDTDIDDEYQAAHPAVQQAYNENGIDLAPIPPGAELWYHGPKAKRWTIGLHDDWSVDFERAVRRHLADQDPANQDQDAWDKLWETAMELANAVEYACDQDLANWLDDGHGNLNKPGVLWDVDPAGYYLIE